MTKDEYIDHELRLRMLEHLTKSINNKMNAGLTLLVSGILLPIILKYLGE